MRDTKITCPVCLRKIPYKELPYHLMKAHPRSIWEIYAAELYGISEEERELIFQAIKKAEEIIIKMKEKREREALREDNSQ